MVKRYLVTSALPYINGVKHLGNLIGSMLPADVFARFLRQSGKEVLFLCGTDEHGTPAEIAAQEVQQPVADYCAQMYAKQKEIYEGFGIDFDFFGRTSSPSNHALTTEIFEHLYENGYIEEKTTLQYYSVTDARFLPDRYVEGTCPHCQYEKARGDQCDKCSTLLNPEDLIAPYSSISHSTDLELRSTTHFFLNMPKLANAVAAWVEKQTAWSDIVRGIAKKWLNEGLVSRCITRDLQWGIPVPLEWIAQHRGTPLPPAAPDTPHKVFYVWFDAPNGYISITQDWATAKGAPEAWKDWWLPEDEKDVEYVQFMAKDNVPFHSIFWPSILVGTGMPFKRVDDIKGFHWLTYDGGKFSTSQKRGVFSDTALTLFPADYWRYYLLANCPESADSDFTFQSFAKVINKDLADILGNFTNRTLALLAKYYDSAIPLQLGEKGVEPVLKAHAQRAVNEIAEHLTHRRFRQASSTLRALWAIGNTYITEREPWHAIQTNPADAARTLTHCVHLLRTFAIASYPFIPATAERICKLIQLDPKECSRTPLAQSVDFCCINAGHTVKEDGRLFMKIDDNRAEELERAFAGK